MDLQSYREYFEQIFNRFIQETYPQDKLLHQACRYVLEGGGKRIRPTLLLISCEVCGGSKEQAILPAIAVEMIHTYSLVHDDLPCMDDDDLRRGRPTVHKAFDEATALLVGDALLSDCWAVLSGAFRKTSWAQHLPGLAAQQALEMVQVLAQAVGSQGMVLGQNWDLYWTGRPNYQLSDLDFIHQKKTGALMGAACQLGALAAGAPHPICERLRDFGEGIGLAFQVVDDLLDEWEGTGKTQGKDKAQGKMTYLSLMQREQAEQLAKRYTEQAIGQLQDLGEKAKPLQTFAEMLLQRRK